MSMSLRNNQKFKFMDKLASQCVCSVCKASIPSGPLREPLYLPVLLSSQRVPCLTVWDRVHTGGC